MKCPDINRILVKVEIIESCWIWNGVPSTSGYGKISIENTPKYTHRVMFEYYYGQICPDLQIDHLCKNKLCVNPIHLEQVSQKTNILRSECPSAINARKTHCKRGHEFNDTNTAIVKNRRVCRSCRRMRLQMWRKNIALS